LQLCFNIVAEIVVGVELGYWMEYTVTTNGNIPQEHDLNKAEIQVTMIDGKKIHIDITSYFTDGKQETSSSILDLQIGQIGDAFIIPATLNIGDTFLEQTQGTITISKSEEKNIAGAARTTITATTPSTMFYWDKTTGFLVEATSTYTDFSIHTKAEKTNIWQPKTGQIDPIMVAAFLVLVITVIIITIRMIKRKNQEVE
jgi:hypothetical protein